MSDAPQTVKEMPMICADESNREPFIERRGNRG